MTDDPRYCPYCGREIPGIYYDDVNPPPEGYCTCRKRIQEQWTNGGGIIPLVSKPNSTPIPMPEVSTEVKRTLDAICESGQIIEVRAKSRDGYVYSGYGQNLEELAHQVDTLDTTDTTGIYLTLNPVNPALMARRSRVGKVRSTDPLTSDADIVCRRWLPIDLDPVRPSGVSSTNEEKAAAQKKARLVVAHLTGLGWPAPVLGDSGNGYHVLYRINLPNDDPARDLVKGCLESLASMFSDKAVSVDTKNFNAARIWKLYGTTARKGEDTQDRPHRKARILSVPDTVAVVQRELLEAMAAEGKQVPTLAPTRPKGKGRDFDLADWLNQYERNLPCKVIPKIKAGHRYFYHLDPCPFSNGAHSDGAYLGQMNDGAVFAKCHHNSCGTGNRWRELRSIGEPGYNPMQNGKADTGVDEAKDEDTSRILPFFEKDGGLYLNVIEPGGTFGFVHEENGNIRFESTVITGGDVIKPAVLPVHHDTRETVFVVGVPQADLVKAAPLLNPADLYTLLDGHINKYCDMPDRERELAVYYALYTWFYTKTPTSPYLRFLGDTGKGKSRLTEVVSDICLYPIKATGSSTTSGIMRFHERWRGTLVIDEGDLRGGAEDPLVKFLNIGFEDGKYIIMSDTNDPNNQLIFLPFGPKVLAMREPFRDNATEGRCLSITPYETSRKDIPPELSSQYHDEVDLIRATIARFVLHNWQNVDGNKMMDWSSLDIEGRLIQMSRPISVILQLFPDGQSRFREYLSYRQQEIKRMRSQSFEGSLFNSAYLMATGEEAAEGIAPEVITGKDLAEVFKSKTGTVNRALTSIGFEIEHDHIKVPTKDRTYVRKSVKKLVVPSPTKWREMTKRYWYSDSDEKAPDCPDILRGKHWIEPQQKLTMQAGPGTNGTDGMLQNVGVGNDQHPSVSQSDDNKEDTPPSQTVTIVPIVPTTILEPSSIASGTNGTDGTPFNGGVDHESISTAPLGLSLSNLLDEYGLPRDTNLNHHVLSYKPDISCSVNGCMKKPQWANIYSDTKLPLCEEHMITLRNAMKTEQKEAAHPVIN